MSFMVEDDSVLFKYTEIWNKNKDIKITISEHSCL